jgi:uncharacterized RDD family membrane protein YckC
MKCPKCGYLGFETTDRCRNCQYDFSLAPLPAEPELALKSAERTVETHGEFDLPALKPQTDTPTPSALDLDKLFGAEESTGPSELPFEDAPIVPPPAARPPLAVRRGTTEVPRHRPRTTRPIRPELQLEPEQPVEETPTRDAMSDTVASLMEMPALGARVGAAAIDALLLVALDAVILYLTLRVSGLQNTMDDIRVLPIIPFGGFLALLAFGYVAAFTVAGGQTVGKMLLSLRVIGDDGRPIDAAGGVLRAAGCMLVPLTLGMSYVPVLVTAEHRAVHDRIAGTRVVRE